MSKKEMLEVFKNSCSKSDVCRKLNIPINGTGMRKVAAYVVEFGIDISHFDGGAANKRKWKIVEKTCPVCDLKFEAQLGHPKEQIVCGHACSNTYFRSGKDNGNYDHGGRTNNHRVVCA